jgi:hypothetical protein
MHKFQYKLTILNFLTFANLLIIEKSFLIIVTKESINKPKTPL